MTMRHPGFASLLLLAACRFDPSGIGGGDDVPIDADPNAPDAPPNPIDGGIDAEPVRRPASRI
jgi:hypothetical protein